MKEIWDINIAKVWKLLTPPGKPSKSELAVFEGYVKRLKRTKNAKILILGSTPELRDLSLKHGIKPIVIDYHPENFYHLKKLMKYMGEERLINSDWRKINLSGKYDLIMGDIAFNMVPLRDWPKMFKGLSDVMKKECLVVHRMWMRIPGKFETWDEVAESHRKRKHIGIMRSLIYPLVQNFYDDKKRVVHYSQVIVPGVKRMYEHGFLDKKDYEVVYKCWHPYKMPNSPETRRRTEHVLRRYFKIKDIKYGRDWFREFCPIYILSKK
jgi:hypothetical protein